MRWSLNIGTIAGTAVVLDGIAPTGANAVVDTVGHVHLAAYDNIGESSDDTTVRVLDLGP